MFMSDVLTEFLGVRNTFRDRARRGQGPKTRANKSARPERWSPPRMQAFRRPGATRATDLAVLASIESGQRAGPKKAKGRIFYARCWKCHVPVCGRCELGGVPRQQPGEAIAAN